MFTFLLILLIGLCMYEFVPTVQSQDNRHCMPYAVASSRSRPSGERQLHTLSGASHTPDFLRARLHVVLPFLRKSQLLLGWAAQFLFPDSSEIKPFQKTPQTQTDAIIFNCLYLKKTKSKTIYQFSKFRV